MYYIFLFTPHSPPFSHPSPHTTHPPLLTAPPTLRLTTIRTKRSSMMSLLPYMVEWSQVVWRLIPSLSTSYFRTEITCGCWAMFARPIPGSLLMSNFCSLPITLFISLSLFTLCGVFLHIHTFTCLHWLLVTLLFIVHVGQKFMEL